MVNFMTLSIMKNTSYALTSCTTESQRINVKNCIMRKMTDRQLWFRHSEHECCSHWKCVMFSIYHPIILHYPGRKGTMQTVKREWW